MYICIHVCITSNKYICIFVYRYQLDPHKLSQHFFGSTPKFFPFFCTDQFPLNPIRGGKIHHFVREKTHLATFDHPIVESMKPHEIPVTFRIFISYNAIESHEIPLQSHYNPIKSHTYPINISYISIKSHFHIPLKSH